MAKQYFTNISRRWLYGILGCLVVIVLSFVLFVPHYKPLHIASYDELNDAHQTIIKQFFVASTTCRNDNEPKTDRYKEFNRYFKVNKFGNRAVIRGCNDADSMLAKTDAGTWVRTDVNIVLTMRQNPVWQKACLIDDITTADDKVRPENSSIDATNKAICDKLIKTSYIHF